MKRRYEMSRGHKTKAQLPVVRRVVMAIVQLGEKYRIQNARLLARNAPNVEVEITLQSRAILLTMDLKTRVTGPTIMKEVQLCMIRSGFLMRELNAFPLLRQMPDAAAMNGIKTLVICKILQ